MPSQNTSSENLYPAGDPRWFKDMPKNKIRLGDAWASFRKLEDDPEETKYVFEMINALAGQQPVREYRKFLKNPGGRAIIEDDQVLLDVLTKRDWLRGLPEGTLGRTYIDFLDHENLSPEGLKQAEIDGLTSDGDRADLVRDPGFKVFTDRLRDSHDLWHIVSGYGRDGLGETALLAFSHAQLPDRGTGAIVLLSCLEGLFSKHGGGLMLLKACFEGWRNGKRAGRLMPFRWEDMMELPLAEVREKLNIRWPSYYHACLKAMAADPNSDRYDQAFLNQIREGAYMPIAPEAAFTP